MLQADVGWQVQLSRLQLQPRHTCAQPDAHMPSCTRSYSQPLHAQAPAVVRGTTSPTIRSASTPSVFRAPQFSFPRRVPLWQTDTDSTKGF
jgi:hypothetical protein